jgi:NAD(P)-dependent dehydrogenase (short-subunit alcohol dehydrogenase family)
MTDPLDRFLLTGKVCVVTGGSRGLGLEMVRAFAAALYFASDASSWTTGAILPVDGGMP